MIQEKTPTLSKGMMTKMGMGMGLDLVQKVPLMMYNHTQSDRVPHIIENWFSNLCTQQEGDSYCEEEES